MFIRLSLLLLIASTLATTVLTDERTYCSGTLVTNSDGTVSCVTQVGKSATGMPVSQVTNVNTGVTSYVTQTGVSSTGQPIYSVTNQYGQVISPASAPAPAPAPVPAPVPAPAPAPAIVPAPAPATTTNTCTGGSLVPNSDGTISCITQVGTSATGMPISQATNVNTGATSYFTQTGVSPTGQPVYSITNQYGQVINPAPAPAPAPAPVPAPVPAPAPAPAPAPIPAPAPAPVPAPATTTTCTGGTLVANSDGTRSCVVRTGTCPSGYPINKVTNVNTGVVTYVSQTGVSATGQPITTVTNQYCQPLAGPAPATSTTCTGGTLVANSDGTRSCVVRTGTCPSGYPINKVTNVNTGVVTYVSQTGVSATGQPIMTVTNQYCQPLAG